MTSVSPSPNPAAAGIESQLKGLAPLVTQVTEAALYLDSALCALPAAGPGIPVEDIRRSIKAIQALDYQGYRELVGLLNLARQDEGRQYNFHQECLKLLERKDISPQLRAALTSLNGIYERGYELSLDLARRNSRFADWPHDFLDQGVRLVRAVYPLGVSVFNAALDPALRPPGIEADKELLLANGAQDYEGSIRVFPSSRHNGSIVHYVEPQATKGRRGPRPLCFEPLLLKDSQAALVGRPLSISTLFGHKVDLEVPVACELDGERCLSYSRGGILIIRHEGKIFVFDRGSKSRLTWHLNMGGNIQRGEFDPKSIKTIDGRFTHGQTNLFGP